MKHLSPPLAGLRLAVLALLAFGTASLRAEDVYITGWLGVAINGCPPSCPYNLGTGSHSLYWSTACPVARNGAVFGVTTNAAWAVTPTLSFHPGVYRILVTKGTALDCPADLVVNMTATGGTLADAGGTAQTTVPTTAFQGTNSVNSWTLVGYITNIVAQPTVTFAYAGGGASRFHMDAVDFQSVDDPANRAWPAQITQILHSSMVTIAGTGPVAHPFALVSSTNLAKALDQWTPEKTNTDDTGSFTFSVTPGAAKARFFRVITQ
jgi:hypothetical protein